MDLKQLRYFVQVAEAASLTAASSRAFITQSALSRQVKLLEEDLGVPLFERRARGVRLTEQGHVLLKRAALLLHEADELRDAVAASGKEPTGPLRIGSAPALRRMVVAPALSRFRARHPKVKLTVKEGASGQIIEALGAGEIDLAVIPESESAKVFRVQPLASEALCLIEPAPSALRMDRPLSLSRLAERQLILMGYPNSLRQAVDKAASARGISLTPVMEADMAALVLDLVREGMGQGLLPYSAVHDAVQSGAVAASPVRQLRIHWSIAESNERTQTIAVRAAIDELKHQCASRLRSGVWRTATGASAASLTRPG